MKIDYVPVGLRGRNQPLHFQYLPRASLWEKADVNKVCKYILSQPKHHHKITFAEEYESLIKFYQMTLRPVKPHSGGYAIVVNTLNNVIR